MLFSPSFFQAPQMVFFKDAVQHIVRSARVFRQPGGHMLMVSVVYNIQQQLLMILLLIFFFLLLLCSLSLLQALLICRSVWMAPVRRPQSVWLLISPTVDFSSSLSLVATTSSTSAMTSRKCAPKQECREKTQCSCLLMLTLLR